MTDDTGRMLLLSEDRFFLVPREHTLAAGGLEAMDLDGSVFHLDPEQARAYEVGREEAAAFVQAHMGDAFRQATELIGAFTEVFRRTGAAEEGPGTLLRGMMAAVLGVSGDPERMARLRESLAEVAEDLDDETDERVFEALLTFPERLQETLAHTRDAPDDEA